MNNENLWDGSPKDAMRIFLENDVFVAIEAARHGAKVSFHDIVPGMLDHIDKIARESYPLFHISENSDLVFHAEGPGAQQDFPWLSAFSWLTHTADKNIRALLKTTLNLLHVGRDDKISDEADLRLTGIAPGSLWVGVKLMIPASTMGLPEDKKLKDTLFDLPTRLPMLASFIGDEDLRPEIREAEPDPALLDAALSSLLNFAPTGKRGIHTLELASKKHGRVSLSQRERVVLRQALKHPKTEQLREITLDGEIREANLDQHRFHLRTPDGIVRCAMKNLSTTQARQMLGRSYRVKGKCETTPEGRPRLLFVDEAAVLPKTAPLIA